LNFFFYRYAVDLKGKSKLFLGKTFF